jgi:hypothetical protein
MTKNDELGISGFECNECGNSFLILSPDFPRNEREEKVLEVLKKSDIRYIFLEGGTGFCPFCNHQYWLSPKDIFDLERQEGRPDDD